jgi:multicomponent Na+:H+ antiporter subunit F
MNAEVFLTVSINITIGLLILAAALTLLRLWRGPTLADRVLALDLLTMIAAGLAGLLSQRSGAGVELDIALALCLVAFVATAAFARFILSRGSAESPTLENGGASDD